MDLIEDELFQLFRFFMIGCGVNTVVAMTVHFGIYIVAYIKSYREYSDRTHTYNHEKAQYKARKISTHVFDKVWGTGLFFAGLRAVLVIGGQQ